MAELNMTNAAALLKRQYGVGALNTYDFSTPMLSQVKKSFNLGGERFEQYVPLSSGGGRGTTDNGTVPQANVWKMDKAFFSSTENLSSVKLKRTTKYATQSKEHAFVSAQETQVKRGVILFRNNTERQIMGDGTGQLGSVIAANGVAATGNPNEWDLTLLASTFVEAHWEEGDYVNIGTGSTDLFEVMALDPDEVNDYATPVVTVLKISGNTVPANSDAIFMQGSENNDMQGARGILKAGVGSSVYGIPVGRRWKGWYKTVTTGITISLMDQVMLGVHRRSGESPNFIVTSYIQWRLLKATLEGLKRYNQDVITPRFNAPALQKKWMDKAAVGRLGFKAMVYDGPFGSAPVVISPFCQNDEMFFFNMRHFEIMHMRGFGWHDDDGTVFLREAGKTNYEARYGGDMETWLPPSFHGVLDGLSTS